MPAKRCPLSGEKVKKLITRLDKQHDAELLDEIRRDHPDWNPSEGISSRLLDQYSVRLLIRRGKLPKICDAFAIEAPGHFLIPPTPLRLNASPDFTGRGVTICFIDSGFYPHPDLIYPENRILHMEDITHPGRKPGYFDRPYSNSWHGTMTAVTCAGNGHSSQGLYRGIASKAKLILLKVMKNGRISSEHITEALRWAIKHREMYNIRIINLSVADDYAISYHDSPVSQAVEDAYAAGICVVAAIGNDPSAEIKPPANSPGVIAVGGIDDQNTPDPFDDTLYPSTWGRTVDNLLKPDLSAPAIWIAAPILPKTADAEQARSLFELRNAGDAKLQNTLLELLPQTGLDRSLLNQPVAAIRAAVEEKIERNNLISGYYKHVDGTSFAAPIVTSILAQMLEAAPNLPAQVAREIVLKTARPIANLSIERQGHGIIHAMSSVAGAQAEAHEFLTENLRSPRLGAGGNSIVFLFHHHEAQNVHLAGDFTGWTWEYTPMVADGRHNWVIEIPLLSTGMYQYKFVIDGQIWENDPRNSFREPDGFGDWNSVFWIPGGGQMTIDQ